MVPRADKEHRPTLVERNVQMTNITAPLAQRVVHNLLEAHIVAQDQVEGTGLHVNKT